MSLNSTTLNAILQGIVSPDYYAQALTETLQATKAKIINTINSLINNGNGYLVLNISDDDTTNSRIVACTGQAVQDILNGVEMVALDILDAAGNVIEEGVALPSDVVWDSLTNEFEYSIIASETLEKLIHAAGDMTVSDFMQYLEPTINNAVTNSGTSLVQVIRTVANGSPDFTAFKASIIELLFPSDDNVNAPFTPTKAGAATSTSGLGLWLESTFGTLSEYVENSTNVILGVTLYIADNLKSWAEATGQWLSSAATGLSYWWDNLWDDEFATSNKVSTSRAFSNGFFELCDASPALTTIAEALGVSESAALYVPILGADLYVYFDSNAGYMKVGMCKHLYDRASSRLFVQRCGSTGNSLEDVIKMSPAQVISCNIGQTQFATVDDYNSTLSKALFSSEQLITAGLLAISGEDLVNSYYQAPDLIVAAKYRYMWSPKFTGSNQDEIYPPEWGRDDFVSEAVGVSSTYISTITSLVNTSLVAYLDRFSQGGITKIHSLVGSTVTGAWTIMDDALTLDGIKTSITTALTVTGVVVAALLSVKAVLLLKSKASAALVTANRLVNDTSVDASVAGKAVRKANMLANVAGIATNSATANALTLPNTQSSQSYFSEIIQLIKGS